MFVFRFLFRSGNPEHPGDRFYNTTVEVLPQSHVEKQSGILDNAEQKTFYPQTEDNFLVVGNFSHLTGIAEGDLRAELGPINTLRLKVHSSSDSWIVLNEVSRVNITSNPFEL